MEPITRLENTYWRIGVMRFLAKDCHKEPESFDDSAYELNTVDII